MRSQVSNFSHVSCKGIGVLKIHDVYENTSPRAYLFGFRAHI